MSARKAELEIALQELRVLVAAVYQVIGAIAGRDDDETLTPVLDLLSKAQLHQPLGCNPIQRLLPYRPKDRSPNDAQLSAPAPVCRWCEQGEPVTKSQGVRYHLGGSTICRAGKE